jgi:hypothetical protein
MKELAGRLAALDADAGAAVQVIAYFDTLVEGRAGLEAIVRGMAALSGCPARLVDAERGVRIGVTTNGTRTTDLAELDPSWPRASLVPGGHPALWLERAGPPGVVENVVLERAAAAARAVLDRTRGRVGRNDPALIEVLLDPGATAHARRHAADWLGLGSTGRVVVFADGGVRVEPPGSTEPDQRSGIGPEVSVLELPDSLAAARKALRFTADGSDLDPGPRVVDATHLGGLVLLADLAGPETPAIPDVQALETAIGQARWVAATLQAVAFTASLRAAATDLNLHHSTLQGRLSHAERWLGWPVHDPSGRLRLQVALILRRLHRSDNTH